MNRQRKHKPEPRVLATFKQSLYLRYLRENPKARIAADEVTRICDLNVMVGLVRDTLPENGRKAYRVLFDADSTKEEDLKCIVSGFLLAATYARHAGELQTADRYEQDAAEFENILTVIKADSKPRSLGALQGFAIPGATLYMVCLSDYITAKTGDDSPSRLAHVLSAILMGLDHFPLSGVEADLLAKKIEGFRERNPLLAEDSKRKAQLDPSGNNFWDLHYSKSIPH